MAVYEIRVAQWHLDRLFEVYVEAQAAIGCTSLLEYDARRNELLATRERWADNRATELALERFRLLHPGRTIERYGSRVDPVANYIIVTIMTES